MKDFLHSLLGLWKQLGVNQRVSLVVAIVAVLGMSIGLLLWSQRPDYQLLFGRLSEKDASSIVSALQSQNIPYKLEGGSIFVPAEHVHRQRMDLASKGLPTGDGVGFEIFDKGQFGLSDFVQRTNYLRALQGELARTIAQMDGVAGARVMIVQPENRLLLTEQGVKSTASVFVELGRNRLSSEAVNSIRHFVANSVQGLDVDDVAVVDQRGRVLSEELREDPLLGTAVSQIRYRQQVEDYLAGKVETMLSPVVGAGNAVVRVAVEIETASVVRTEERYEPDGQVLRSETTSEDSNNSTEARAGGATGVTSNTPEAPSTNNSSPTSVTEEKRKNRTLNYEINRTLTNITRNAGTITDVRAAVFVAERTPVEPGGTPVPRTPAELEGIRQIVVSALGLRAEDGVRIEDLVTVQEAPFQVSPLVERADEIQETLTVTDYLEMAGRYSGIGIAALVLLIFLRMLRKQEPATIPVEVLRDAETPLSNPNGRKKTEFTADMLNEMIRNKPANVSSTLRDWVANNSSN